MLEEGRTPWEYLEGSLKDTGPPAATQLQGEVRVSHQDRCVPEGQGKSNTKPASKARTDLQRSSEKIWRARAELNRVSSSLGQGLWGGEPWWCLLEQFRSISASWVLTITHFDGLPNLFTAWHPIMPWSSHLVITEAGAESKGLNMPEMPDMRTVKTLRYFES